MTLYTMLSLKGTGFVWLLDWVPKGKSKEYNKKGTVCNFMHARSFVLIVPRLEIILNHSLS
jgi:hypothetical protein